MAASVIFSLLRKIFRIGVSLRTHILMEHLFGILGRMVNYVSSVVLRAMGHRRVMPCHCLPGNNHT